MADEFSYINWHAYSFGDIELRWGLKRYKGLKSINYKHSREVEAMLAVPDEPTGWPKGAYMGGEGSILLLRATLDQMIIDVGDGYMEEIFTILATRDSRNQPERTDQINGATLTEEDFTAERGGEGLYVTRAFKFLSLWPNGFKPMRNMIG